MCERKRERERERERERGREMVEKTQAVIGEQNGKRITKIRKRDYKNVREMRYQSRGRITEWFSHHK